MSKAKGLGLDADQIAVNLRGIARVRAAMHQAGGPVRSLEHLSQAITDAAQVRDAYAHALHQVLVRTQEREAAGNVAGALADGAKLAAATVQLKAAQGQVNRLLAEFQVTAEGIR